MKPKWIEAVLRFIVNEDQLRECLPAYLNDSLSASQRRQVEAWLERSHTARAELAAWQKLQGAVRGQSLARPSADVRARLMGRIEQDARQSPARPVFRGLSFNALAGAALTLIVLALLWFAVQPGVALQWTLEGAGVASFNIYRAVQGSDDFTLLAEIPAQRGAERYRFVDVRLWPGRAYVYRVEGVGQAGEIAASQSIASGPLAALPGQLAILFTSLVIGYSFSALMRLRPAHRSEDRRGLPV